VFDTGKQRATDSDVPYAATKETTQVETNKHYFIIYLVK